MGATNVRLRIAKKAAVREALTIAWQNRAPKRLGGAASSSGDKKEL
jgi:hypothetical protein